ncbi:dimethylaniline monooxygenase, partial [Aspergillus ellipticus CBS 707.79]
MSQKLPSPDVPSYSQIACVGTGLTAVALGATLQRWYGLDDIHFFDRHPTSGGTWSINSYPGAACDVPSALYSYSFELNPDWTQVMPASDEIKQYQDDVMKKYHIEEKMTFATEVTRCVWRDDDDRWLLYLRDVQTGRTFTHECQILFAATGMLVEPRPFDVSGVEDFHGSIFHSARWNHDIDLEGKNVIVIGNGCTAAQIVPALAKKVNSLTQIVRSQHWIFPAFNFTYPSFLRWVFRYIPFAMKLHRFHIFLIAENGFRLFPMTKAAARLRESKKKKVEKYMRATAPAKYHDILIPDFEVGCKRRIFDSSDYLQSLHNDNLLLTDAKIEMVVKEGIQTSQGLVPADAIVLATGFQTNKFLPYMDVLGRDGKNLTEHCSEYGGPSAYNCSVLNGFPNFFMLLGPNSATGHTSALMAAENSVNYALRILKPVLEGKASTVEIKLDAEREYVYWMQDALRKRVWNSCASWYVNEQKWNSSAYPWTQGHYWWRSLFPVWSDWNIKATTFQEIEKQNSLKPSRSWSRVLAIFLLGFLGSCISLCFRGMFSQAVEDHLRT